MLWLLVIAAVVAVWGWYRQSESTKVDQIGAQDAEAIAETDPYDVLVDLKDDATPDQIAAIERDLGIKLVLVDDTAADTKLYRAAVGTHDEAALVAALAKRAAVGIVSRRLSTKSTAHTA